jgi:hypothetical protein
MKYRMCKFKMAVSDLLNDATGVSNILVELAKSCAGMTGDDLKKEFVNAIVERNAKVKK